MFDKDADKPAIKAREKIGRKKRKVKLKRTVTIEIDCIKITSDRCFGKLLWCDVCREQAKFLSPAEVLKIAEIAELAGMIKTIDKRFLHFYQLSATERLICLKSILGSSKLV